MITQYFRKAKAFSLQSKHLSSYQQLQSFYLVIINRLT